MIFEKFLKISVAVKNDTPFLISIHIQLPLANSGNICIKATCKYQILEFYCILRYAMHLKRRNLSLELRLGFHKLLIWLPLCRVTILCEFQGSKLPQDQKTLHRAK